MGGVMANWKGLGNSAIITLLAVCAMTYLAHPDFTAQAAAVKQQVAEISQPQLQEQMTIPIAVVHMLPEGIKGLLCIILLMGIFGGDGTHLLSWGSLFIQDVILPLRKKTLHTEAAHPAPALSMVGVAVFAFCFGCLFKQTEYVMMWWAVTEAIYVGGAGVAIIGGLYWKEGNDGGSVGRAANRFRLGYQWHHCPPDLGRCLPVNGAQIGFFGAISACLVYGIVSLLTCRKDFDMDRMLHRGKYAVKTEQAYETVSAKRVTWGRLIGFDEHFTLGDKCLAGGLFGWSMLWFGVLVIGSIWNLTAPWPLSVWSHFWFVVGIGIPVFFAFVTAIWFTGEASATCASFSPGSARSVSMRKTTAW